MTTTESRRIAVCRICGSDAFTQVVDFGMLAPCGVFPATPADDPPPAPLEVIRCEECGLVQLAHDLPPEVTFTPEGFGYRSGTNPSMVRHLKELADFLVPGLKPGDTVVDIGSNDGTFLKLLPDNLKKVGVDPVALRHFDNYPTGAVIIADFWNREAAEVCRGAKAITCFAALYDLPDPVEFMQNVDRALGPDGVFMCEVAFLPGYLQRSSWDVISHEHLMYFDLATLHRLMRMVGLKMTAYRVNDINGGSIMFTAARSNRIRRPWKDKYNAERLADDVAWTVTFCTPIFDYAKYRGHRIHGYAASTRGNTLLQVLKSHGVRVERMRAISDANPDKHGKFTPGTLIPIMSERESRRRKPEFYFVLASHFMDSFVQRERAFLERGGRFFRPFGGSEGFYVGKAALG